MWRLREGGDPVDVIIEPDKGMVKEIGKQLLELAGNPSDVQWVSWPKAGYKVSVELADKLKGVRSLPNTEQPGGEPAPRRRGRPRKQTEAPVEATDDTEKEE